MRVAGAAPGFSRRIALADMSGPGHVEPLAGVAARLQLGWEGGSSACPQPWQCPPAPAPVLQAGAAVDAQVLHRAAAQGLQAGEVAGGGGARLSCRRQADAALGRHPWHALSRRRRPAFGPGMASSTACPLQPCSAGNKMYCCCTSGSCLQRRYTSSRSSSLVMVEKSSTLRGGAHAGWWWLWEEARCRERHQQLCGILARPGCGEALERAGRGWGDWHSVACCERTCARSASSSPETGPAPASCRTAARWHRPPPRFPGGS